MEPAIIPGDCVLVNKALYGARLFDLFEAIEGKKVSIKRMPGFGKISRNDIMVFHFPYPKSWDKIEMDMRKYFVKRCVGISGDTIYIKNGIYQINNDTIRHYGNYPAELVLSKQSEKELTEKLAYNTFPWDSILHWNIKNFGPLYIPKKGDTLILNRTNALLYKKIIEWEKGIPLDFKYDKLWDKEKLLSKYTFRHNYYFVAGDNIKNSQDSRYWGLLPDDFIVGKVWLIWKSVDPDYNIIRWNRIFKTIH